MTGLLLTLFEPSDRALAEPPLPEEPVAIGHQPQFLFDGHVVDNHWALRFTTEAVRRVVHRPVRHPANPLIAGRGGYVNVHYDEQAVVHRMWYQTHHPEWRERPDHPKYAIAYAESADGLEWELPNLGQHQWRGGKDNNICWLPPGRRGASGGHVIDAATIPESDRRGYRYIMVYSGSDGLALVGSEDGVRWDDDGAMTIKHIHSDTYNNIVYDPDRRRYVMTLRPKHVYRAGQEAMIDSGMSRRVARLVNDELWTEWSEPPQTLLLPDETDADRGFTAFYGMGVTHAHGLFWGFLWPFKFNDDIYTELVVSRDAEHYRRFADQPRLIDMGEEGAWDDGMVYGGTRWIEAGNQWRLYYAGHDGPHGSRERTAGIGLATIRKHGFVSLLGPPRGGVVVTRRLVWPGGKLVINADARKGDLTVRVSDAERKPLEGFDHADCVPFRGDNTDHVAHWNTRSIEELAGESIRLEFYVRDADLYSFRAATGDVPDGRIDPDDPETATPEPVDLGKVSEAPAGGEEVLSLPFDEEESLPAELHGAKVVVGDGEDESTSPRWIADGRQGGAMGFAKPGVFLRVGNSPAYRPATGRIELWFRPRETLDDGIGSNKYLFYLHQTSALRVGLTIGENGRLRFFSHKKDAVPLEIHSDRARWEAGRWYRAIVAFGEGGLRLYVDGILQRETDPSPRGLDHLGGGSLFIGSALPRLGGDHTFPGDIDEVRIVSGGE